MLIKLLYFYWRDAWNTRTLIYLIVTLFLSAVLYFLPLDLDSGYNTVFSPVNVSIVDEDKSLISHALISQFSALAIVENVYEDSYEQAQERLKDNQVLLVMFIPEGFYEQTRFGLDRSALTVYLNRQMPAETSMFVRILGSAADGVAGIQSALYAYQESILPLYAEQQSYVSAVEVAAINLAFKLMDRGSIVKIDSSENHNPTAHVVSTLICLLAMMSSLLLFMQVQQERKNGLHERFLLANVKWWQASAARVISGLAWLLTGFVPVFILLGHFYPEISLLIIALLVLFLYAITSLLCLFLAYSGRTNDLMLLVAWLGLLILLLLGGCIYPRQLLPDWFQVIGGFSPAYWTHLALYNLFAGLPLSEGPFIYLTVILVSTFFLSWPAFTKIRSNHF